jgi:outer membrane lipoprotein-sorting protein
LKTIILALLLLFTGHAGAAPDARELLLSADRARGGGNIGLSWSASVLTVENGESSTRDFSIRAQGDDAYVEAKAPARYVGEVYIFNGRNMWFYKPSLKKPVPISARQKLTGQAANGDIASTNYVKHYSAEIEKQISLEGRPTYVLLLTASGSDLTYDKVRYYIDAKTKMAKKAEFLNLEGEPIKFGYLKYDNKLTLDGQTFPFVSELKIVDALNSKNSSTIFYKNVKAGNFSKSLFNINNLSR